ncbi:hypothetical protein [Brevundimonas sp. UBA7664]|uniref:hypothetical protein n=1 Tax=Brevundimonas sp. UBA7664 TaxID=1946141 RepID=UPI0025C6F150|nr:hypothetical protein [Brevundimonas sp. UBA7664]
MTERSRLFRRAAWGLKFPLVVTAFLAVAACLMTIAAAMTGEPVAVVLTVLAVSLGSAVAAFVLALLRSHLKGPGRK